jgi:hypothetical protein
MNRTERQSIRRWFSSQMCYALAALTAPFFANRRLFLTPKPSPHFRHCSNPPFGSSSGESPRLPRRDLPAPCAAGERPVPAAGFADRA